MKQKAPAALVAVLLSAWALPSAADSTQARCEIYPKGSDKMQSMVPCTFGQRQGYITITRNDGVSYDLSPVGDTPGNFRDQDGNAVYRQSGLGEAGLIFRFPTESVFVYWDTAASPPAGADNATAPFATRRDGGTYDATTLLRCKAAGDRECGNCPAGILRMEDGQASIVIQSQLGQQFTVNFMTDSVNATVGKVDARLQGDLWTVTRDNGEVYEVPLSAIEGG
jgi:hypothetical protein